MCLRVAKELLSLRMKQLGRFTKKLLRGNKITVNNRLTMIPGIIIALQHLTRIRFLKSKKRPCKKLRIWFKTLVRKLIQIRRLLLIMRDLREFINLRKKRSHLCRDLQAPGSKKVN